MGYNSEWKNAKETGKIVSYAMEKCCELNAK